jgi:hypothetical protein
MSIATRDFIVRERAFIYELPSRLVPMIGRSHECWIHNQVNLLDQLSEEKAEIAVSKLHVLPSAV